MATNTISSGSVSVVTGVACACAVILKGSVGFTSETTVSSIAEAVITSIATWLTITAEGKVVTLNTNTGAIVGSKSSIGLTTSALILSSTGTCQTGLVARGIEAVSIGIHCVATITDTSTISLSNCVRLAGTAASS